MFKWTKKTAVNATLGDYVVWYIVLYGVMFAGYEAITHAEDIEIAAKAAVNGVKDRVTTFIDDKF